MRHRFPLSAAIRQPPGDLRDRRPPRTAASCLA